VRTHAIVPGRPGSADTPVAPVAGLGPLQRHMDDEDIHEVMVSAGGQVFVEGPRGIRAVEPITAEQTMLVIERITRFSGRRVDVMSPVVDVHLPDGSRACVVLPPVAVDGPAICIRKFSPSVLPLTAFTDDPGARRLRDHVTARRNIVVCGATSSGKTSLLGSLVRRIPARERLVIIEDTTELRLDHPHMVRLQTRPANVDGAGEVTAQHLVRASMRLRPDRLVVGEVRGGEVVDMLLALTSGHDGCMTTVHARSVDDALHRLVTLALRDNSQFPHHVLHDLVHRAVDVVVHVERARDGSRRIVDMRDLSCDD
jgi:pilus assembly protein CpaF